MRTDWLVVGRAVQHKQCGVEVRFDGPAGAYAGHGPTYKLRPLGESGMYYVPPVKLINPLNPYHTKDWQQLLLLVEEARQLFEGHL